MLPTRLWCRKPGSNRYRMLLPRDFKSRASTNFAIPALDRTHALVRTLDYYNILFGVCQVFFESFYFLFLAFKITEKHAFGLCNIAMLFVCRITRGLPPLLTTSLYYHIQSLRILFRFFHILYYLCLRHCFKHRKRNRIIRRLSPLALVKFINHILRHSYNLKSGTSCNMRRKDYIVKGV